MKRKIKVKIFLSFLCIFMMVPSFGLADAVNYFYDDAGRLTRVLKGTEGLIYQYDEVGNLLSIDRGPISALPPSIQSIMPDLLFIGSSTPVTITGTNLFTTKEVQSNNSSLTIRVLNVTDTEIEAEMTVSSDALNGTVANITVTTLYGQASIQVTLSSSRLTFSPGQLAITPGGIGDIAVSIFPSVGRDLTITLKNSSPATVSVPNTVTVPSSGTTTFSVNGINEGVANISSGTPRTVVFVTEPFAPEPGEPVINKTLPVSVYIEPPLQNITTLSSLPVSVDMASVAGDSAIKSLPVSVSIEPDEGDAIVISLPISVAILP